MKQMNSEGLRCENGELLILDQQLLPDREVWLPCKTAAEMVAYIRALKVRGAPLIGVAAATCLGRIAESGANEQQLLQDAEFLRSARPTAVNLMWAVDRMVRVIRENRGDAAAVIHEAERIFEEDVALCAAIADHGAAEIRDGEGILTHCNAGALATAGIGTAVGIIRRAHELGKKIHVYVDETRPLLQGGRLTAWEMRKHGIPHTLICDNMAAGLMRAGKIQRIFVGADRIAVNGDFANKIGTYGVAVLAQYHGVPFYAAAPYSTVDLKCPSGHEIPIEQRDPAEVRGVSGSFGSVRWSPEGCPTYNPSFDVTPADLVEALVLDRGVFRRQDLKNGVLKNLGGTAAERR